MYGANNAFNNITYGLVKTSSTGAQTTVAQWVHPAGTKTVHINLSGVTLDQTSHYSIQIVSGFAGGNGYSVTLQIGNYSCLV